MLRRAVCGGLFCVFVGLLTSCASEMSSKVGGVLNLNTDLKLSLVADPDVNPDEAEKPSPVFVRLYELKDTKTLDGADFLTLYERDKEILGKNLISKQELKRLAPGDTREESFILNSETQYIALFAEFFDYKGAKYKAVFPVTRNNILRNVVTVRLSGNRIFLEE